MKRTTLARRLVLAAGAALLACSGDDPITPPGTLALSVSRASLTVTPGNSDTLTATVVRSGSFSGIVSLAATGAPEGVSVSLASPTLASGTTSTGIRITLVASTAPGVYPITLTASGAGVTTQTATVNLTVVAAQIASFTLAGPSDTVRLAAGDSATALVRLTKTGGFQDAVVLTTGTLATGLTVRFAQPNLTGDTTSARVSAASTLAAGTYTLELIGTSGTLVRRDTLDVVVRVAADLRVAFVPDTLAVVSGATGVANVRLTRTGGFTDVVRLTVSGARAGVTATLADTLLAGDSTTALVRVTSLVAAGSYSLIVTASAGTLVRADTLRLTVTAAALTGASVFSDVYPAGVTFVDFGGAANAVTIDPSTPHNGRSSLKAIITGNAAAYSGGAFVAATPRNLSAFNALTFWARASVAGNTLKVGIGNDAASVHGMNAEAIGMPLTTTFQKFIIPIPNPAKFTAANGLFHFADGPNNYTVWFNDIQYENLPAAQVGTPTAATAAWPTISLPIGALSSINPAPNTVSFTTPVLPNGGKLTDVAWRWFTLTSSDPAVATVSVDGVVRGVSAGTASISATLGGITVPAFATVTVTAPLAVPTTVAPAPTPLAADVISLFTTVYPNRGVDTWRTSWSTGGNTLVDPFVVAGRSIKQYTLFNFAGIEYGIAVPANSVDATTMTHFHVDVWSPNPSSNLEIQLVNDGAGTAAIGRFHAGAVAAGQWVQLDIPLASFTGLTARTTLNQLLFVAAGPSVLYIDNVYFRR